MDIERRQQIISDRIQRWMEIAGIGTEQLNNWMENGFPDGMLTPREIQAVILQHENPCCSLQELAIKGGKTIPLLLKTSAYKIKYREGRKRR